MDYYEYFKSVWPNEGVGYLTQGGEFVPLENISADPRNSFEVDPFFLTKKPSALLHSHTIGVGIRKTLEQARQPSATDMQCQIETDIEWGYVVTDGKTCEEVRWFGDPDRHAPLVGREFILNYHDCFTLVKDFLWDEQKVFVPNLPRVPWWDRQADAAEHDHITKNYQRFGFRQVPLREAQRGDVLLYKIASPVINHMAIFAGDNKILTHFHDQLSREASYGEHAERIEMVVRYHKKHDEAKKRKKEKTK